MTVICEVARRVANGLKAHLSVAMQCGYTKLTTAYRYACNVELFERYNPPLC